MLAVEAFAAVQLSVVDSLRLMGFADAAILTLIASVMVIVVLSVADPPGPSTVMVYVVVTEGVTVVEPFTLTVPMPWSMLAEMALVDVQVRVAVPPVPISLGSAVILTEGPWFTFTVMLSVAVPPEPVTVIV